MAHDKAEWMPSVPAVDGCPRGLEYLSQVDQLTVEHGVELLEAFPGWEDGSKHRYVMKNKLGQQIYVAADNTGGCQRKCCSDYMPFEMRLVDNTDRHVMLVQRPHWCCKSNGQYLEVECPPGEAIGYIKEDCSFGCGYPSFSVLNSDMEAVLKLKAPFDGCCGTPKYNVQSLEGEKIGRIRNKVLDSDKELSTQANNFGITFPMDLDIKLKATLLAALFMINFSFFLQEQEQDKDKDSSGTLNSCLEILNALAELDS